MGVQTPKKKKPLDSTAKFIYNSYKLTTMRNTRQLRIKDFNLIGEERIEKIFFRWSKCLVLQ